MKGVMGTPGHQGVVPPHQGLSPHPKMLKSPLPIDIPLPSQKKCTRNDPLLLPHSAHSWILSKAENLANSSLHDGATK